MTSLRMINRIGKRQRRRVAVEKVSSNPDLWGLYFIGDNNKMPYVHFTTLDKAWEIVKSGRFIQFGMMR